MEIKGDLLTLYALQEVQKIQPVQGQLQQKVPQQQQMLQQSIKSTNLQTSKKFSSNLVKQKTAKNSAQVGTTQLQSQINNSHSQNGPSRHSMLSPSKRPVLAQAVRQPTTSMQVDSTAYNNKSIFGVPPPAAFSEVENKSLGNDNNNHPRANIPLTTTAAPMITSKPNPIEPSYQKTDNQDQLNTGEFEIQNPVEQQKQTKTGRSGKLVGSNLQQVSKPQRGGGTAQALLQNKLGGPRNQYLQKGTEQVVGRSHQQQTSESLQSIKFMQKRGSASSQAANRSLIPTIKAPQGGLKELKKNGNFMQFNERNKRDQMIYNLGEQDSSDLGFIRPSRGQFTGQPVTAQNMEQRKRISQHNLIGSSNILLPSEALHSSAVTASPNKKSKRAIDYTRQQANRYMRQQPLQQQYPAQLRPSDYDNSETIDLTKSMPRSINSLNKEHISDEKEYNIALNVFTTHQPRDFSDQIKIQDNPSQLNDLESLRKQQEMGDRGQIDPDINQRLKTFTTIAGSRTGGTLDPLHTFAKPTDASLSHNTTIMMTAGPREISQKNAAKMSYVGGSRINHNTSALAISDSVSVASRHKTKRAIDKFKAKNVSSRIRQQKQARRFQQYSRESGWQEQNKEDSKENEDRGVLELQARDNSQSGINFARVAKQENMVVPTGATGSFFRQKLTAANPSSADRKERSQSRIPSSQKEHFQMKNLGQIMKTQEDQPTCPSNELETQSVPQSTLNLSKVLHTTQDDQPSQVAADKMTRQTRTDEDNMNNIITIQSQQPNESQSQHFPREEHGPQSMISQTYLPDSKAGIIAPESNQNMGPILDAISMAQVQERKSMNSLLPVISSQRNSSRKGSQGGSSTRENAQLLGMTASTTRALVALAKHEAELQEEFQQVHLRASSKDSLTFKRRDVMTEQYLHTMVKTPRQMRHESQLRLGRKSSQDSDSQARMQEEKQQRATIQSQGMKYIPETYSNDAYFSPSHLISQRPQPPSKQPQSSGTQKFKNRRVSKNLDKPKNSILLKRGSRDVQDKVIQPDSPKMSNPYDLHQPTVESLQLQADRKSSQPPDLTSMYNDTKSSLALQTEMPPALLASVEEDFSRLQNCTKPNSQASIHREDYTHQPLIEEQKQEHRQEEEPQQYSHPIPNQFQQPSSLEQQSRFEQWDVAGLGAVPYAINSGAKSLIFRPYYGQGITLAIPPKQPLNKGFFFKFNSSIEIKLVKYTLEDNGLCEYQQIGKHQLLPNQVKPLRDNWLVLWTTQSLKNGFFSTLLKHQKVNHFPRSIELTRKDFLANRIHRMQDVHGKHHFNFWPRTYILPREADLLHQEMETSPNQYWICKPTNMAQGKGIFITNELRDIPKSQSAIVSHYISNPLTVDKLKFDLRIYVAVTSLNPLRIYMYDEGLVRFATAEYSAPSSGGGLASQKNRFIHLTNYSINKKNHNGSVASHTAKGEAYGSKWSFKALRQVLREHNVNDERLFGRIKDIVIKTIISSEPILNSAFQMHVPFRNNCFQLFGFDVMIDDELNPWLLEVNLSPSLSCDSPLDHRIKSHLVADLLNLAGITNVDQSQAGLQNQTNLMHGQSNQNRTTLASNGKIVHQYPSSAYGQNQALSLKKTSTMKKQSYSNREKQFSSIATQLNSGTLGPNRVAGETISKKDEMLLREAEAEFKRKGRFSLIFPATGSSNYKSYFEEVRPLNTLLHRRCVEKNLFTVLRQQDRDSRTANQQGANSNLRSNNQSKQQVQQQQRNPTRPSSLVSGALPSKFRETQDSFSHVD